MLGVATAAQRFQYEPLVNAMETGKGFFARGFYEALSARPVELKSLEPEEGTKQF